MTTTTVLYLWDSGGPHCTADQPLKCRRGDLAGSIPTEIGTMTRLEELEIGRQE